MAVDADLYFEGGHLDLSLYPNEVREQMADDPPELPGFSPGSMTWPYYDAEKLGRDEYEFLGIEILDVAGYTDEDIALIESLPWPRVNIPEHGLTNLSVADVLGWVRQAQREALARGEGHIWGSLPSDEIPSAPGTPSPSAVL